MLMLGGVLFNTISTTSVLVHPFTGSVVVTVYAPGPFIFGALDEPPYTMFGPAQLNVAPGVAELAFRFILLTLQFNTSSKHAFAPGGIIFWVTSATSVLVQPFEGFVVVMV